MSIDDALNDFDSNFPGWGILISRENPRMPYVVKLCRPPEQPDASITDSRSWSRQYEAGDADLAKAVYAAMAQARVRLNADGDNIG
ncbi:MAG: hypothetical protein EOP83_06575 [Verrucomicrobiaceae bacterium]|nr:MAG: hypothetical protein EOP83_06575 [Verrucomicrobiaceae bacterium]